MKMPKQNLNKSARVGLGLLFLLTVFGLVACYPMQERVVSQPVAGPPRPTLTQVYFYPQRGQTVEQQSRDHYECYNWAIRQTGFDPSNSPLPPEQRVRVVPLPPPGHDTAAFAVVGAVLGAILGGRHAAGGALIGAAGGAVAGAASDAARQEEARRQEEAYAKWDQARYNQFVQKELDFRRAMGACLEGRGYSVK